MWCVWASMEYDGEGESKGKAVMVGSASLCCHPWPSIGQLRPS